MNELARVRLIIGGTDPVGEVDTSSSEAVLGEILGSERPARQPVDLPLGRRRPLVTAAAVTTIGVALAAAAVFAPGFGSQSAQAATPPLLAGLDAPATPGAPALERIADQIGAGAAPSVPSGRYQYVRTEGWALNTAVSDGHATSTLEGHQSETWRLRDGTGRRRTAAGVSMEPRTSDRAALDEALDPAWSDEAVTDHMPDGILPEPVIDLDALPTGDVPAFALGVDPGSNVDLPVGVLAAESIQQLFVRQPVPADAAARVWRLLATVPGVVSRGRAADRLGREGLVFTIEDDGTAHGLPSRYALLIDPATGALLEYDEILTTDPGKLNVSVPATLDIVVYVDSGYSATTNSRP